MLVWMLRVGILGFIGDGQFLAFVPILLQSSRLLGKQTKCTPQSHALIVFNPIKYGYRSADERRVISSNMEFHAMGLHLIHTIDEESECYYERESERVNNPSRVRASNDYDMSNTTMTANVRCLGRKWFQKKWMSLPFEGRLPKWWWQQFTWTTRKRGQPLRSCSAPIVVVTKMTADN